MWWQDPARSKTAKPLFATGLTRGYMADFEEMRKEYPDIAPIDLGSVGAMLSSFEIGSRRNLDSSRVTGMHGMPKKCIDRT